MHTQPSMMDAPTLYASMDLTDMEQRAMHALSVEGSIGALHVESLTQQIRPFLLLHVIEYRQTQGLAALPYCDKAVLEAFHQQLNDQGIPLDSQTYLSAKALAQALPKPGFTDAARYQANAGACLARTSSWYIALVQYQQHAEAVAFENATQWLEQMAAVVYAFTALLWALIQGMLLCLILSLAIITPIPGLGPVAAYYLYPPLKDAIHTLLSSVSLIASSLYCLVTRTYRTCFASDAIGPDERLQTVCEQAIMRLKFMNDDSANQKGACLEAVGDKIQDDCSDLNSTSALKANRP